MKKYVGTSTIRKSLERAGECKRGERVPGGSPENTQTEREKKKGGWERKEAVGIAKTCK